MRVEIDMNCLYADDCHMRRGRQLVGPGMVAERGVKAALLTSTIFLALVGAVAAEERDPRLKDRTIDFNTVDLSTLPPLQFTFVPEWRKLEGFRRFVFGRPINTPVESGDFCSTFWRNLNEGVEIEVVEPVLQTNHVADVSRTRLGSMCPNYDFEYKNIKHDYDTDKYKVRYGVKVFDISTNEESFIFEYGLQDKSPEPDTAEQLNLMLNNANDPYERRRTGSIMISGNECRIQAGAEFNLSSPFMMVDNIKDMGVIADRMIIRYMGDYYIIRAADYHLERSVELLKRRDNTGDWSLMCEKGIRH